MFKKYIIIFLAIIFSVDTFAASSVKMLGTNVTTNNAKTVTTSQVKQSSAKVSTMTPVKTVNVANTNTATKTDTSRVAMPVKKQLGSVVKSYANTNNNVNNNNNVNTGGVSDEEIKSLVARIEFLEKQIADNVVVIGENEDGRYVTDIDMDENKINVRKTKLIYVPVRNGTEETISGDAEIWIVR